MVGPITIDDIMSQDVVTIDIKKTVQDALDIMESHSLRKVIITIDNQPKYILEDWKAWRLPKNKTLEEVERELRRIQQVESGTNLEEVRRQLEEEPAVLIRQNNKMIGIATATDLTKLIDQKRQWKIS